MLAMTRHPTAWLTLCMFVVASCSTTMNIRKEDYHRIEPENKYRIIMMDNREYEVTQLVITGNVATFQQKDEKLSLPVDHIREIQQIHNKELLTGVVALGIVGALVGGLIVLLKPD